MLFYNDDFLNTTEKIKIGFALYDKQLNLILGEGIPKKFTDSNAFKDLVNSALKRTILLKNKNIALRAYTYSNYIFCTILDFTIFFKALKENSIKLCASYEKIMESLYDGLFITDNTGVVLYVNNSSEYFSGKKRSQLIGKNVSDLEGEGLFYPSVTVKSLVSKSQKTVLQDTNIGKKLLATATPIFNENNEIHQIVSVTCDVTELFNLKKELEKKDEIIKQFSSRMKQLEIENKNSVFTTMIFSSQEMDKVDSLINKISSTDINVIILGESGVGKTMISRLIHDRSHRSSKPFQVINCSIIPENLLESELFGYEKGSFTGANEKGKAGLFELANGGTIFLDEIGELNLSMQVKLLQVIQEKKIRRVGGNKEIDVDFRLIAATNQDLSKNVSQKLFREDLYYRINGFSIKVPPLRERKSDIETLSYYFLNEYNKKYNQAKKFSRDVLNIFYHYDWPGNIRELQHVIESSSIISDYSIITPEDLPENFSDIKRSYGFMPTLNNDIIPLNKALEIVESELIRKAYDKYKNSYKVAEALEISQTTAHRKIQKYIYQAK